MKLTLKEAEVCALKKARILIDGGSILFICNALDYVEEECASLARACHVLKERISQEIIPYNTLGAWIKRHYITDFPEYSEYSKQQCRLAWIDKMIYDLESDILLEKLEVTK